MIDLRSKCDASPFDPSDPEDRLAERARLALIDTALKSLTGAEWEVEQPLANALGGLLVGLVQVMQAATDAPPDQRDAAIRASIHQLASWAVDHARSIENLPPLSDRN